MSEKVNKGNFVAESVDGLTDGMSKKEFDKEALNEATAVNVCLGGLSVGLSVMSLSACLISNSYDKQEELVQKRVDHERLVSEQMDEAVPIFAGAAAVVSLVAIVGAYNTRKIFKEFVKKLSDESDSATVGSSDEEVIESE